LKLNTILIPSFISSIYKGISILADMWHAPSAKQAVGTATTGSSEAAQLGGLAMKRLWQERRKAAGKSIHEPG
jgi:glutamate decarboxylase